jgi:regulator of replication initiation timing
MSFTHTSIASDLNEKVDNRYSLTLEIAELAKRLMDNQRERRKHQDPFAAEIGNSYDDEKVIYQALIMKSSEVDLGDGLIG